MITLENTHEHMSTSVIRCVSKPTIKNMMIMTMMMMAMMMPMMVMMMTVMVMMMQMMLVMMAMMAMSERR